jgi:ribonuclease HI
MTVWQQKWLATGALNRPPVIFKADKKNKDLKEIKNADLIKHLLVLLRRRHHRAKVWFEYVPAHTGLVGNEAADVSCPASHAVSQHVVVNNEDR